MIYIIYFEKTQRNGLDTWYTIVLYDAARYALYHTIWDDFKKMSILFF